jgi:hypothetical protein
MSGCPVRAGGLVAPRAGALVVKVLPSVGSVRVGERSYAAWHRQERDQRDQQDGDEAPAVLSITDGGLKETSNACRNDRRERDEPGFGDLDEHRDRRRGGHRRGLGWPRPDKWPRRLQLIDHDSLLGVVCS